MEFLVPSLLALFVGPLLARALRAHERALAVLDGFVITAIVGLVALHILPHSISLGGLGVLVAAGAGVFLPGFVERRAGSRRDGRRARRGIILAVALGLAVHAALDGAALGLHDGHGHGDGDADSASFILALSVVLHRIPVGLAVWGTAAPAWGARGALALIALNAVATVVGYAIGGTAAGDLGGPLLGVFEALVAGSLLHVVVGHRLPVLASAAPHRVSAAFGAVAGVAANALVVDSHAIPAADAGLPAASALVTLVLEAAPALLAGFALFAFGAWLAPRVLDALRGATPRAARAVRDVAGALFGVVRGDAGGAATLTVGPPPRPALGAVALLVSLPLLGPLSTLGRVGVVLAATAALELVARRHAELSEASSAPPRAWRAVALAALDHEAPWVVFGILVAAVLEPVIPYSLFAAMPPAGQAAIAVVVASPWYLSAAGLTPIAALLLHKGAAPGAVIALLVVGPMLSLKPHPCRPPGARMAPRQVAAVALAALVGAWIIDALAPAEGYLELHASAALEPAPLAVAAALAFGLIVLAALFRQGPRGFIAQVTGHGEDAHNHGPVPTQGEADGDGDVLDGHGHQGDGHGHEDHDHGHDHDHGRGHDHGHGHGPRHDGAQAPVAPEDAAAIVVDPRR